MKKITVAIDGPAGAGKSSAARMAAQQLGYLYIDTGAMYRAFTWVMLDKKIDMTDKETIAQLAKTIDISLEAGPDQCRVYADGREITDEIRTPYISSHVSQVAALAVVRQKLVQLQRKMAAGGGVILDGRDIGTVVLPQAELKIFLTASVTARARRRFLEVQARGGMETLAEIERSIAARDEMDSHRAVSPLKKADDAVLLDNSSLTLEETAAQICQMIEQKEEAQ